MKKIISFTIEEGIIESLQDRAEKQKRSVSQMAEILLEEGLKK